MYHRYVVSTSFLVLALVLCLTNLQAQIMPPVLAPSIYLKGAVSDGGKVQLAWEVTTKDTVKYFTVYRAAFPDTAKYAKIADSLRGHEFTDFPPRPAITSSLISYVYYVTGTSTKGTILRSNLIVVLMKSMPPQRESVKITSDPPETGQVGVLYTYQVKAVSSDTSAVLSYALNNKPTGMTITASGLVNWTPANSGFAYVEVGVKSSMGGSASQRFTIRVSAGSGSVAGTVTDTTGTKFIGQVVVYLLRVDPNISFDYKGITDASGRYKINGVDAGSYYVRAEPLNGEYLGQWYDGSDGATSQRDAKVITVVKDDTTTVNFKLQPRYKPMTYIIKGSVIDSASHAPLKGASVNFVLAGFAFNGCRGFAADPTVAQDFRGMFDGDKAIDFRLDGNATQFVFKARTDSAGNYSLKLPAGSFIAFAEAAGHIKIFYKQTTNFLLADTIRVSANMDGINFNMPPIPPVVLGEINGTISDSTSDKGVRARVIAFRFLWTTTNSAIVPLPASAYKPMAYMVDTDTLGRYSFTKVVPGEYIVFAVPMGSYVPAYYSSSGSTQNWRKATPVAVNGNVVAGIDINVRSFSKSSVGYTFMTGTVSRSSSGMGGPSGNVGVIGAIVYAMNSNGTIYGYDVTDERGAYAITGAAPGSYTLFVDAPGFTSSSTMQAAPTYGNDSKGTAVGASGVDFSLTSVATSVENNRTTVTVPADYVLAQNYPNPFNPTTQILFSLPKSGQVTLSVYNLIGQRVAILVDGTVSAGSHVVTWSGRDSRGVQLPSGVYFYRLESSGFTAAKRMLMLK